MSKNKKHNKMSFGKYLSIFLLIVSVLVLVLVYFINVLPLEYFIVLVILVLITDLFAIMLLLSKGRIRNVIGILLTIILLILMIFGITYELNTLDFLKQFGFNSYKTENYNVIVLDSSEYDELEDLNDLSIAHLDLDTHKGLQNAVADIKKEIKFTSLVGEDISDLTEMLESDETSAIILESAQLSIIEEENKEFYDSIRIIWSTDVEIEIAKIGESVDVTKDSFNILISGIDTYGSITKVSRSDVNILVTVNPSTHSILLTSIPRDYYVLLPEFNEYDKLTHAGIYGIETSVSAVENLLDTTINYYIKVNFTSLIDIVDALGGITVESNYDFTTQDGYHFTKGTNELNGKEALSFARERKAFADGDRIRGQNQELILASLINKAMSASIITNYVDLLNALDDKFVTNITDEEITDFIKKQISEMPSWNINAISLDGSNAYDYTYSYKSQKLYVMKPYEESVLNTKEQINNTLLQ
ncbi:MAG TPA: LCP family protein [Candidatus Onthocola stercoravium]|nr:LCP family protein [Candidatus Onthocola stercoravium]